jgi:hypothetical protein
MPTIPQSELTKTSPEYGPSVPGARAIQTPMFGRLPGSVFPASASAPVLRDVESSGAIFDAVGQGAKVLTAISLKLLGMEKAAEHQRLLSTGNARIITEVPQIQQSLMARLGDRYGEKLVPDFDKAMSQWFDGMMTEEEFAKNPGVVDELRLGFIEKKAHFLDDMRTKSVVRNIEASSMDYRVEASSTLKYIAPMDAASDSNAIVGSVYDLWQHGVDRGRSLLDEAAARESASKTVNEVWGAYLESMVMSDPARFVQYENLLRNYGSVLDPEVYDKEFRASLTVAPDTMERLLRQAGGKVSGNNRLIEQKFREATGESMQSIVNGDGGVAGLKDPTDVKIKALGTGLSADDAQEVSEGIEDAQRAWDYKVSAITAGYGHLKFEGEGKEGRLVPVSTGRAGMMAALDGIAPDEKNTDAVEYAKQLRAYRMAQQSMAEMFKKFDTDPYSAAVDASKALGYKVVDDNGKVDLARVVQIQKDFDVLEDNIAVVSAAEVAHLSDILNNGDTNPVEAQAHALTLDKHASIKALYTGNPNQIGLQRVAILLSEKERLDAVDKKFFDYEWRQLVSSGKVSPNVQFYALCVDVPNPGANADTINLLDKASRVDKDTIEYATNKVKVETGGVEGQLNVKQSVIKALSDQFGEALGGDDPQFEMMEKMLTDCSYAAIKSGQAKTNEDAAQYAYDTVIKPFFEVKSIGNGSLKTVIRRGLDADISGTPLAKEANARLPWVANQKRTISPLPGPIVFAPTITERYSARNLGSISTASDLATSEWIAKVYNDEITVDPGIVPIGEGEDYTKDIKDRLMISGSWVTTDDTKGIELVDEMGRSYFYTDKDGNRSTFYVSFDTIEAVGKVAGVTKEVADALIKKDAALRQLDERIWKASLGQGVEMGPGGTVITYRDWDSDINMARMQKAALEKESMQEFIKRTSKGGKAIPELGGK